MKSFLLLVVLGVALNEIGVSAGGARVLRQICTYKHGVLVSKLGDGAGCGLANNYAREKRDTEEISGDFELHTEKKKRYIEHVDKIEAGIVNNYAGGPPADLRRSIENPIDKVQKQPERRSAIGQIGNYYSGTTYNYGREKREELEQEQQRERRSAIAQIGTYHSGVTYNYGRDKREELEQERERRSAIGQIGNYYTGKTYNYGREKREELEQEQERERRSAIAQIGNYHSGVTYNYGRDRRRALE